MHRRGFLQNAAIAVGGATCLQSGQARETVAAAKPRRATLAQVVVHKNVKQNLTNARRAFEQAGKEKADVVLFPEAPKGVRLGFVFELAYKKHEKPNLTPFSQINIRDAGGRRRVVQGEIRGRGQFPLTIRSNETVRVRFSSPALATTHDRGVKGDIAECH